MSPLVKLSSDTVDVAPGATATLTVSVRNSGTVVDQFAIEVIGDAAPWATVEPPELSLFPSAEGTSVIKLSPPRASTTPAGTIAVGVRVRSREDPEGTTVEEATLSIAAFADVLAELLPRTSSGSRSASHEVAVDNRGNERVSAAISGSDPDQLLTIEARPPSFVVEPGTAAFGRVRVKPRRTFWRGQPKTRPFVLEVDTQTGAPLVLQGSMVQNAMLPGWTMRALAACLGIAVVGLALWFGLLQPSMRSAAEQAFLDHGITPTPSVGQATPPGSGGANTAPPSIGASATPKTTAGPTGPAGPSGGPVSPIGGTATDGRLVANAASAQTPALPPNATLYVTDLVFANPTGLAGTVELRRGDLVIATLKLENFRDLDYHFVTPIVVKSGQALAFNATCTPSAPCNPSVYYSGFTIP